MTECVNSLSVDDRVTGMKFAGALRHPYEMFEGVPVCVLREMVLGIFVSVRLLQVLGNMPERDRGFRAEVLNEFWVAFRNTKFHTYHTYNVATRLPWISICGWSANSSMSW